MLPHEQEQKHRETQILEQEVQGRKAAEIKRTRDTFYNVQTVLTAIENKESSCLRENPLALYNDDL